MTDNEKARELLKEYKELPYTLVGNTSLTTSFGITLTAEGLRKILEKAHDGDLVAITIHDKEYSDFEVIHMKRSQACNHTNSPKVDRK